MFGEFATLIRTMSRNGEPGRTDRSGSVSSTPSADVVEAIKEKLLNCSGRELRRTLFSLKQTFQEDKDLVRDFVESDGLTCLISVGKEADQNYQNYILRALGQVMLYVDGMKGVIRHNQTIQWLYSILSAMVSPAVRMTPLTSHSFPPPFSIDSLSKPHSSCCLFSLNTLTLIVCC